MKEQIKSHSIAAGYKKSLLPEFSDKERKSLKGTYDYLGVNMYTSNIAKSVLNKTNDVFWRDCMDVDYYQPSSWKSAASAWLKVHLYFLYIYRLRSN